MQHHKQHHTEERTGNDAADGLASGHIGSDPTMTYAILTASSCRLLHAHRWCLYGSSRDSSRCFPA